MIFNLNDKFWLTGIRHQQKEKYHQLIYPYYLLNKFHDYIEITLQFYSINCLSGS